MFSHDLIDFEERLHLKDLLVASNDDLYVGIPGNERIEIHPGSETQFTCLPHPFLQQYPDEVDISLRSAIAQSGFDINYFMENGVMHVTLINANGLTAFSDGSFALGAPYKKGRPLDYTSLINVSEEIQLLERSDRRVRVLTPGDDVPHIEGAVIALPVAHHYGRVDSPKRIDLGNIAHGPERHLLSKQNGVSVYPNLIENGSVRQRHTIEITGSPKLALPRDLGLVIIGGIALVDGEWKYIEHVKSTLLKPYAVNGDQYRHRIRFETRGITDYILCEGYRFMYDQTEKSSG